jgi:hypothetical protein
LVIVKPCDYERKLKNIFFKVISRAAKRIFGPEGKRKLGPHPPNNKNLYIIYIKT